MLNTQEFANEATNYKKLINKRRGRACTRKEKKQPGYDNRIVRDKLLASFASREYHREKKAFEKTLEGTKEKVDVPDTLHELRALAHMHDANFRSAVIVRDAMKQFPPLT